ncbi:MAG: chemotaxis protein CheX [Candidatus Aquicultor sp.]
MFQVNFINPFVEAAFEVFEAEVKLNIERGALSMKTSSTTSHEVNVLIGITGQLHGQVIYGMSNMTAKKIAVKMLDHPVRILNDLAQSAISELGNMITGVATAKLDTEYANLAVTPPAIVIGTDVLISTIGINRLIVPLKSELGPVEVIVAFRDEPIPDTINILHAHRNRSEVFI